MPNFLLRTMYEERDSQEDVTDNYGSEYGDQEEDQAQYFYMEEFSDE